MRKLLKNKIKGKSGFTLAETLLAVLIMLMVSAIVVAGIPAAKNAYENVVLGSNADVLLSTAISSLRNELGIAKNIKVNGNEIQYYNEARGAISKIRLGNDPSNSSISNTILLQRYAKEEGDDGIGINGPEERLVSGIASTDKLYVTYRSVVNNVETNGTIDFSDVAVKRDDSVLAQCPSLSIRVIYN